MTGASPSIWMRWCRFNFVGGIGMVAQFAVLFMLKSLVGLPYLVATAIAVEITVVHNFIWHERFTWADRCNSVLPRRSPAWCCTSWIGISWIGISWSRISWSRDSWSRLLRFSLGNGAVSLVGNLALMKLMAGQGHMNYLLANAIAIALCSVANFVVSHKWVFEQKTN